MVMDMIKVFKGSLKVLGFKKCVRETQNHLKVSLESQAKGPSRHVS